MASDSSSAVESKTLLDLINDKYVAAGSERLLSRVLYVAKLQHGVTSEQVVETHRQLIMAVTGESVTGLCLAMKDAAVLHVMESSEEAANQIIRCLLQRQGLVQEVRVLTAMSDCIKRSFSSWWGLKADKEGEGELEESSEEVLRGVFEMYTKLLKVGSSNKGDGKKTEELTERDMKHLHQDNIPTTKKVVALTKASAFPTAEEFLDLFDTPINLELESERTWPAPQTLLA